MRAKNHLPNINKMEILVIIQTIHFNHREKIRKSLVLVKLLTVFRKKIKMKSN
jgi:hypothetical protein